MGLSEAGVKYSIDRVEVTDACLTGRAGLALISKYLKAVGVEKMLTGVFSFLKKSSKGTALASIFHPDLSKNRPYQQYVSQVECSRGTASMRGTRPTSVHFDGCRDRCCLHRAA